MTAGRTLGELQAARDELGEVAKVALQTVDLTDLRALADWYVEVLLTLQARLECLRHAVRLAEVDQAAGNA